MLQNPTHNKPADILSKDIVYVMYYILNPFFFRTLTSFELWMKKGGKSTDYFLPTEMLVMINVVLDYKNQVSVQSPPKLQLPHLFKPFYFS